MPITDILTRQRDIGISKYNHEILVKGSDLETCKRKVLHFFQNYQLVRYSQINIMEEESLSASNSGFWDKLKKANQKNRQILHELIKELEGEDLTTLKDLQELPQGYKSKMLHAITHLLDGFFGIDTYFYNLEEDSHWVSEELKEKIKTNPSIFWLLSLEAQI